MEYCGGGQRMNLYDFDATSTSSSTSVSPELLSTIMAKFS